MVFTEKIPRILWQNLVLFFRETKNFEVFYAMKQRTARSIDGQKISLRVIEYLLTNYVMTTERVTYILAKHETLSPVFIDNKGEAIDEQKNDLLEQGYELTVFDVRMDYENQITKVYHKKMFDPCCRGNEKNKFNFKGPNGLVVETSLRQMVFFRWAISNCLLEWLRVHAKSVIDAMRNDEMEKKKRKREGQEKEDFRPRLETLKQKRQKLQPVKFGHNFAILDDSAVKIEID
jgi:hypothetical protein